MSKFDDLLNNAPAPSYTDRQLLTALINKAPVKISGADSLPDNRGAITDPETGEIRVRKGMAFADTFRSLTNELALAELTAGHNTQYEPQFSAYCASYLLCQKYGVDTQGFSFEEAPGVFDGMDALDVKGELSQIRNAAENISGRMERQLEVVQRSAKTQEVR